MLIPEPIAQKLDKILGTTSEPYRIWDGEWVDTGCLTWFTPAIDLTPLQNQKLNDAFAKARELIQGEPVKDLDEYERRFKAAFFESSSQLDERTLQFAHLFLDNFYRPDRMFRKRERILARVRHLLADFPVIAYKSELSWGDITYTSFNRIVVAPISDQFDILRIERTHANNRDLTTEEIITHLKTLDKTHGINIVGASHAAIEFVLKQVPKGKEARELGQWLFKLAPDIYEAPRSFPGGQVALWWD